MNESFLFHVIAFLVVCLVASFVMNGVRLRAPQQLLSESLRLFLTISVGIASQLALPGMLVMCKGGGIGSVSGEITEEKILQAYVASTRASGCGASGCGPDGCD